MCGIYKVTNRINGKIYIGKSINISRRWAEHIRESMSDENDWESNYRGIKTYFHSAIRKYGKENFIWEILEECDADQLNEKEKYWIKILNTANREFGYNMTFGGDGYCCGGGENAPGCKITKEEAYIIKQKLKEHWTAKQIQQLVPLATPGIISAINYGNSWFDANESYPISINNGHRLWTDEEAMQIKEEYANGAGITELAKKFNTSLETISNLVHGKSYTNLPIIKRRVDWKRGSNLNRKFSDDEVKLFRKRVENGESIKSVHETSGIKCNYAAFYNMIKGITYKNVL